MKKLILSSLLFLGINFVIFAQSGKVIPAAEFYPGGQDSMYAFIDKHKVYPILAKKNRISGECIINFILNEDGTIYSPTIVKNIGGGCGQEALRVAKLLKFKAPGYKIQTSIPIYFKL
ncbi:energy transducer TonB [Sporocytophaga myxococcoides]|uniref:energy transducer TonB n=1 Tax=Sporocytophaga myxococcoides TaxID=153721 RepID=UPI00041B4404|nr:energy transducer TonB [Sporocytophaga myxococcoides]